MYNTNECNDNKSDTSRNMTRQEMVNATVGSIVRIGCINCEGFEKHEKLEDATWKCLNCGHNEIKFNNKCNQENCSFPECNHICGYNPDKKQE